MPLASFLQNVSINSSTVVAYEHTQVVRRIFKLDLDLTCVCMAKCIRERFAADQLNFVGDRRLQWPWSSLHDNAKRYLRLRRKLCPNLRKCLLKIWVT